MNVVWIKICLPLNGMQLLAQKELILLLHLNLLHPVNISLPICFSESRNAVTFSRCPQINVCNPKKYLRQIFGLRNVDVYKKNFFQEGNNPIYRFLLDKQLHMAQENDKYNQCQILSPHFSNCFLLNTV